MFHSQIANRFLVAQYFLASRLYSRFEFCIRDIRGNEITIMLCRIIISYDAAKAELTRTT